VTAATKAQRGAAITLQAAADAFLSSPGCENANTRRAYAGVIDKVANRLGASRRLADISDDDIGAVLEGAPSRDAFAADTSPAGAARADDDTSRAPAPATDRRRPNERSVSRGPPAKS
jgi:hypothetical protein